MAPCKWKYVPLMRKVHSLAGMGEFNARDIGLSRDDSRLLAGAHCAGLLVKVRAIRGNSAVWRIDQNRVHFWREQGADILQ